MEERIKMQRLKQTLHFSFFQKSALPVVRG